MSNLFANWAINCGIKKIKSSSSLEISYQFRERRYVGVHMRVLWKSAGHLLAFQRAKNNWNVKFFLSYYFGSEKDSQLKGNNLSFIRPFCSPSTGKKADVRPLIRSLDETQAWHVSDPVIYPLFDCPVSVTWMPEEKIEITKREEWVRETGRISQHLQKGTLLKNETNKQKLVAENFTFYLRTLDSSW